MKHFIQAGNFKFHAVFSKDFDLCYCSVIHIDSTKSQKVTLSQEIISGFHFHLHFFFRSHSVMIVVLYMILGSNEHPSIDSGSIFESAQTRVQIYTSLS